jgi:hypothetical protein
LGGLETTWEGIKYNFTWQGMLENANISGKMFSMAEGLYTSGVQIVNNFSTYNENDYAYAGGFILEKAAEIWLTKSVIAGGGNISIGNLRLSVMSSVNAPGMSGYRVLGFKAGKFQAALDYHNWPMRSAKDLAKGFGPINSKFWHYHLGRGNPGAAHRQLGTGTPILDGSQLRSGIFGKY